MKVVPQAFYQSNHVRKVMTDGLCAIIHKKTSEADLDNQRLLSAHALTIVLNGGLMVHTDDGIPTQVNKGQMVLLPKGLYAITDLVPEDSLFEAMVLFLDDALINTFLKQKTLDSVEVEAERKPTKFSISQSLSTFIEQTLTLYGNVEVEETMTRIKLLEALHLIDSKDPDNVFTAKILELRARPRKDLKSFMLNHFDKALDVEAFATLTGRSISSFRRDFHTCFEMAPKAWLIKQRLNKAKKLLEETTYPVSSVATQSGYTDIPHFIKSFQRHFSVSPKQFSITKRGENSIRSGS